MCTPNMTNFIRSQWNTNASTNVPMIFSPWMLMHGVSTLRVTQEMASKQGAGTTTQEVIYRYAPVLTSQPRDADWTASGNTMTANGAQTDDIDVSSDTDFMWVQVALAGKSSSGVGGAYSGLRVQTDGVSKVIAARTLQINPTLNSSTSAYFPLTGPMGSLGLSSLMFAGVISGVSGTLSIRPAWRQIESLDREPSAWTDLNTGDDSFTGNDLWNPGSLTTTPTAGSALYQAGLKVTSAARGTIQVLVAAAY